MDNAAVAFCFDALRHCYHVLGKDRFQAETEFIIKCYAKTEYNTNLFNCALPSLPSVPEAKSEPEAAANQVVVPVEQKPEVKSVAIKKPAAKPEPEVKQEPETETKKTGKWQRTPLPEEQRCQRVLPYNGGQCTFKKDTNSDFCSRHKDK